MSDEEGIYGHSQEGTLGDKSMNTFNIHDLGSWMSFLALYIGEGVKR